MANTSSSSIGGASRTTKKRHPIWSFYNYDEATNSSICQVPFCFTVIKGKFTTNLKKHLETIHPKLHAEFQGKEEETKNDSFMGSQIKISASGELLTKYPDDHKKQREFNECLGMFIGACSTIPVTVVANPDFIKLFQIANERIVVPQRARMSNLIDERVHVLKEIIKKELQSASHITLCLDIYSKKGLSSSFLGIVCCFFSTLQLRRLNVTLAVEKIPTVSHKNQDIVAVFNPIAEEYGIKGSQIWRIVTDAGSNMVAAFKGTEELLNVREDDYEDFLDEYETDEEVDVSPGSMEGLSVLQASNHTHMKCFIHQLIRAMKNVLSELDDTNYPLLKKVRTLVSKVNHSQILTKSIVDASGRKLVGFSKTRWNVIYLICKRIVDLKTTLIDCLTKHEKTKYIFSEDEWKNLQDLVKFLELFYTFTNTSSSDKTSVSEAIPIVKELQSHLQKYATFPNDFLMATSAGIEEELKSRFGHFSRDTAKSKHDGIYLLSTLLDIRYRRALSQEEVKETCAYFQRLLATHFQSNAINSENDNSLSSPEEDKPVTKRKRFSFISETSSFASQQPTIEELKLYLNGSFDTDDENADPIEFWVEKRKAFPLIWHAACEVLSIPISTANVEQIFSVATNSSSGHRNRLDGENLSREVFLCKNRFLLEFNY